MYYLSKNSCRKFFIIKLFTLATFSLFFSKVSSCQEYIIDPALVLKKVPGTVVCKIVHKFASVWCKTALGEVGVSLP